MKKLKKLLALNAADPNADRPKRCNPRPLPKRITVKKIGKRTYIKGWVV